LPSFNTTAYSLGRNNTTNATTGRIPADRIDDDFDV